MLQERAGHFRTDGFGEIWDWEGVGVTWLVVIKAGGDQRVTVA